MQYDYLIKVVQVTEMERPKLYSFQSMLLFNNYFHHDENSHANRKI